MLRLRRAFTLIELVVVLVVVAVLAAIGAIAFNYVIATSHDRAAEYELREVARLLWVSSVDEGIVPVYGTKQLDQLAAGQSFTLSPGQKVFVPTEAAAVAAGVVAAGGVVESSQAVVSTTPHQVGLAYGALAGRNGEVVYLTMKSGSGKCVNVTASAGAVTAVEFVDSEGLACPVDADGFAGVVPPPGGDITDGTYPDYTGPWVVPGPGPVPNNNCVTTTAVDGTTQVICTPAPIDPTNGTPPTVSNTPAMPVDTPAAPNCTLDPVAGFTVDPDTCTLVAEPTDLAAIDVATGYASTCAVTTIGNVMCWGSNAFGALGQGPSSTGVVAVGDTPTPSWAACWSQDGCNVSYGADSLFVAPQGSKLPLPVLNADGSWFSGATKIAMAASTACVLKADDTMWCWGEDVFGSPSAVETPYDSNFMPAGPSVLNPVLVASDVLDLSATVNGWSASVDSDADGLVDQLWTHDAVWADGATWTVLDLPPGVTGFAPSLPGLLVSAPAGPAADAILRDAATGGDPVKWTGYGYNHELTADPLTGIVDLSMVPLGDVLTAVAGVDTDSDGVADQTWAYQESYDNVNGGITAWGWEHIANIPSSFAGHLVRAVPGGPGFELGSSSLVWPAYLPKRELSGNDTTGGMSTCYLTDIPGQDVYCAPADYQFDVLSAPPSAAEFDAQLRPLYEDFYSYVDATNPTLYLNGLASLYVDHLGGTVPVTDRYHYGWTIPGTAGATDIGFSFAGGQGACVDMGDGSLVCDAGQSTVITMQERTYKRFAPSVGAQTIGALFTYTAYGVGASTVSDALTNPATDFAAQIATYEAAQPSTGAAACVLVGGQVACDTLLSNGPSSSVGEPSQSGVTFTLVTHSPAIPTPSGLLLGQNGENGTGGGHVCALSTNENVYCWGEYRFGEIGDGTTPCPNSNSSGWDMTLDGYGCYTLSPDSPEEYVAVRTNPAAVPVPVGLLQDVSSVVRWTDKDGVTHIHPVVFKARSTQVTRVPGWLIEGQQQSG